MNLDESEAFGILNLHFHFIWISLSNSDILDDNYVHKNKPKKEKGV